LICLGGKEQHHSRIHNNNIKNIPFFWSMSRNLFTDMEAHWYSWLYSLSPFHHNQSLSWLGRLKFKYLVRPPQCPLMYTGSGISQFYVVFEFLPLIFFYWGFCTHTLGFCFTEISSKNQIEVMITHPSKRSRNLIFTLPSVGFCASTFWVSQYYHL